MAEIGLEVVQARACYEGRYWNTTGAARQVIIQGIVPKMSELGIDILSHGATGRGNDQVRFQLVAAMLEPQLAIYAPWRDSAFLEQFRGRREMLEYCKLHSIPIKASQDKPYSTDANLLGLTHEGGALEQIDTPMDLVKPGMGYWPKDAENNAERIAIRFEKGRPVELSGERIDLVGMFQKLNLIGGRHGVGIATNLIENRFVGVKSRGVYEAPAMEILGVCYDNLLQLILDRRARQIYEQVSNFLSVQLYQGYWLDLASRMARSCIAEMSALVSGLVEVELYKGNIHYISIMDSPHSLYNNNGSMEDEGTFDHRDSEGLLNILTIGARTAANAGQIRSTY